MIIASFLASQSTSIVVVSGEVLLQLASRSLRKGTSLEPTLVTFLPRTHVMRRVATGGGKRKAILEPHCGVYLLKK
jgi:hypothetical protein